MTDNQGPRCPNHDVLLETKGQDKGYGICPRSGAVFTYSYDEWEKKSELRKDVFGRITEFKNWQVTHHEGDDI